MVEKTYVSELRNSHNLADFEEFAQIWRKEGNPDAATEVAKLILGEMKNDSEMQGFWSQLIDIIENRSPSSESYSDFGSLREIVENLWGKKDFCSIADISSTMSENHKGDEKQRFWDPLQKMAEYAAKQQTVPTALLRNR
ncbi:MAG: hypothetical protein ACP5UH_03225 [Candidatus Micrarchaeia archaeon]